MKDPLLPPHRSQAREGTLQEARTSLAQLVGRPVPKPVEPPSPSRLPSSLEQAMASLDLHPTIVAGLAEVEAARRAAAVASAWDKPAFSLRGRVHSKQAGLTRIRRWRT